MRDETVALGVNGQMLADRLAADLDGRLSGHVDSRRAHRIGLAMGTHRINGLGDAHGAHCTKSLGRYASVRQDGTRGTQDLRRRPPGRAVLQVWAHPPCAVASPTPAVANSPPALLAAIRDRRAAPLDPAEPGSDRGVRAADIPPQPVGGNGPPEKRGIVGEQQPARPQRHPQGDQREQGRRRARVRADHLIWNQVLSYGTDAMITVALAGTVFFGASPHAQRGNVLLYLLITMAPFALIAPVIGPALDRLQHGRRWTMAGRRSGVASSP